MKRIALSLALTALLVPLMGASDAAEASGGWFAGADFSVAGIRFSLGFSDRGGRHYDSGYYYRTNRPLSYRGHECGSACYIRDNVYYHHRQCPLVRYHFHRHGFDPYPVWTALPYYGAYYPRSYRSGYRDYRHDRYYDHRDHRRVYGHRDDADSDSDRYRRRDRRGRDDRYGRNEGHDRDHHDGRGAARSRSRRRND